MFASRLFPTPFCSCEAGNGTDATITSGVPNSLDDERSIEVTFLPQDIEKLKIEEPWTELEKKRNLRDQTSYDSASIPFKKKKNWNSLTTAVELLQ